MDIFIDEEDMALITETRNATSKCLEYYQKDKNVVSETSDTDDEEAEKNYKQYEMLAHHH